MIFFGGFDIDATSVYCRQLEDEHSIGPRPWRWPKAWPRRPRRSTGVDLAVCPPSCYLDAVGKALAGSKVALGAQNMYHEKEGAFTGEISAAMLCDLGCTYVILGHSERRHILGETDAAINKKVHAALAAGLMPIVCVGELLAEREAGKTLAVIRRQFDGSLAGLPPSKWPSVVIAYEPVWAIGTGKVATPQQAEEVHLALRKIIAERYNSRGCGGGADPIWGQRQARQRRRTAQASPISTGPW